MANKRSRYQQFEQIMSVILISNAVLFFLYLLVAGLGIIWLKVITAIVAILTSGICLAHLYLSGEFRKQRSLWMTVGFACLIICLVFSLVLNFPSPKKNFSELPPAVGAVTMEIANNQNLI